MHRGARGLGQGCMCPLPTPGCLRPPSSPRRLSGRPPSPEAQPMEPGPCRLLLRPETPRGGGVSWRGQHPQQEPGRSGPAPAPLPAPLPLPPSSSSAAEAGGWPHRPACPGVTSSTPGGLSERGVFIPILQTGRRGRRFGTQAGPPHRQPRRGATWGRQGPAHRAEPRPGSLASTTGASAGLRAVLQEQG